MRIATLVGTCLIVGCASGPPPTLGRSAERDIRVEARSGTVVQARLNSDERIRTADLALDLDSAWARLREVLEAIGLPVDHVDESAHTIGHGGESISRVDGKRMSTYLDCGVGTTAQPYADFYRVVMSYEVLLAAGAEESTVRAEMRVQATATPRDVSGNALRCTSKGRLERLVFEQVGAVGTPEASALRLHPRESTHHD